MTSKRFLVKKDELSVTHFAETTDLATGALPGNGLLVKIDRFAFTANNITYALLGDQLKYWSLFPAEAGFGIIPVWGFGDVTQSRHPDIAVGERLFGYFPMATHLVIEAGDVRPGTLRDVAPHRKDVSPVYNSYTRVTGDATFEGRDGDWQALMRPLFMLSFLVEDFLAENKFFGARSVLLSSASSKTAIGLAFLLKSERNPVRVVGLTSAANVDFVRSLDCYDDIVTYDRVTALDATAPVAFIDMAGAADLRAALHRHFGERMRYSGRVGLTHQEASGEEETLPGAAPVWFFAPDQLRKRAKDWGPGGIDQRFNTAWNPFAQAIGPKLDVIDCVGEGAVRQAYLDTLNGRVRPRQALMLSLQKAG